MFKFANKTVLATITGIFLATTALPVDAKTRSNVNFGGRKFDKKAKQFRPGRFFFFFDKRKNNEKRKPKIVSGGKRRSLIFAYRSDKMFALGDSRLRQPSNRTLPVFSTQAPSGFDATANLTGGDKLDDSLAQTIFDTLKASQLSTKVTKQQKKAIIAFYKARNYKPLWTDMDGVLDKGRYVLNYMSKADAEGLKPANYLPSGLESFSSDFSEIESDLSEIARLDINITAMALRYGQHASGGQIVPNRLSGYHDLKPPKIDASIILTQLSTAQSAAIYLSSLHPTHPSYQAFKKALAVVDGEPTAKTYPDIRVGGVIKVGDRDERVGLIRTRLEDAGLAEAVGVLNEQGELDRNYYDEQLFEAVKKYQKSKNLGTDGIIGRRTLSSFNRRKNVNKRSKLVLNMERMRWMPRQFGAKHIFVNQPAFQLQVMSNARTIWKTRVVVGKPKNQTSFFVDKMETVVFNPYWGVPQSIITKEMLPRLQANPGYLDARGFELVNSRGRKISSSSVDWYNYGGSRVPFSVRQPPGARNALGRIKFLFPNKHSIYLHDTPSKHLFSRSSRAFSHGCVRVKNPLKFAENVLGWDRSRIDAKIATGKNGSVKLAKFIPVYIAYFTAWSDDKGKVSYYGDVYGRDRRLDRALNTVLVASN